LAKPSNQEFAAFWPTTRIAPLAKPDDAAQCEKPPVLSSLKAPPDQFPTWILPNGPAACAIEATAA
jgi:hypothetical protein